MNTSYISMQKRFRFIELAVAEYEFIQQFFAEKDSDSRESFSITTELVLDLHWWSFEPKLPHRGENRCLCHASSQEPDRAILLSLQ